jgi:hypothetical protein
LVATGIESWITSVPSAARCNRQLVGLLDFGRQPFDSRQGRARLHRPPSRRGRVCLLQLGCAPFALSHLAGTLTAAPRLERDEDEIGPIA